MKIKPIDMEFKLQGFLFFNSGVLFFQLKSFFSISNHLKVKCTIFCSKANVQAKVKADKNKKKEINQF